MTSMCGKQKVVFLGGLEDKQKPGHLWAWARSKPKLESNSLPNNTPSGVQQLIGRHSFAGTFATSAPFAKSFGRSYPITKEPALEIL
eukprot:1106922-Amphidinium_carterae.2